MPFILRGPGSAYEVDAILGGGKKKRGSQKRQREKRKNSRKRSQSLQKKTLTVSVTNIG